MAYLLYVEGDSATTVARGQVMENAEAQLQLRFGIGANEKLLPIADSVTITAGRIINGITLNAGATEITALSYAAVVARTTAQIKADARLHLRSRMDEMQYIWGPMGQRWRNCRLWLLSMAAVIGGICDVIDDDTHSQHANWSISDAESALAAAKALAPEEIPAARLVALATALGLTQPADPLGVRFWYFGHGEVAWRAYTGAVDTMPPIDPLENLSDEQKAYFGWVRGGTTPAFASDASSASRWAGHTLTPNTLDIEFNAQTDDIEGLLA